MKIFIHEGPITTCPFCRKPVEPGQQVYVWNRYRRAHEGCAPKTCKAEKDHADLLKKKAGKRSGPTGEVNRSPRNN